MGGGNGRFGFSLEVTGGMVMTTVVGRYLGSLDSRIRRFGSFSAAMPLTSQRPIIMQIVAVHLANFGVRAVLRIVPFNFYFLRGEIPAKRLENTRRASRVLLGLLFAKCIQLQLLANFDNKKRGYRVAGTSLLHRN